MEELQATYAEYAVSQWFQRIWTQETKWFHIFISMPRLHVPYEQDWFKIISSVICLERFRPLIPLPVLDKQILLLTPFLCVVILLFFFPLSLQWEGIHFNFGSFEDLVEIAVIWLFPGIGYRGNRIFLYMMLENMQTNSLIRNYPGINWALFPYMLLQLLYLTSCKMIHFDSFLPWLRHACKLVGLDPFLGF